jgi:hypothetical protein
MLLYEYGQYKLQNKVNPYFPGSLHTYFIPLCLKINCENTNVSWPVDVKKRNHFRLHTLDLTFVHYVPISQMILVMQSL